MSAPASPACARCGATLSGRFCAECGAPAQRRVCVRCQTPLSPGARFCHRCGEADRPGIDPRRERAAWVTAGTAAALTIALVALQVARGRVPAPAVPEMGNTGTSAAGAPGRAAPDISRMSPRERFDRLFDRVVGAAERGQRDTVAMFAPMALDAYAQLPQLDADARYHAAMIHLALGNPAQAQALADTILTVSPRHLFGYLVRGEAAETENDAAVLSASYAEFLKAYNGELAAGRPEYQDHRPAIDDFRTRALANRR
jgi:hypothetical protein